MNSKGILVIVSGFAGAGKGTIINELIEKNDNYALSISATTRKPRSGEEEGREYFFKTISEFEELIKNDSLLEYAKYVDNYYGTPKDYVNSQLESGKDVILEIEIQGALKVKEKFQDAILVFILPPSGVELKNRLISRGTEEIDVIDARLKRAYEECGYLEKYDYVIVNDNVDEGVDSLHKVVQCEHKKVHRNMSIINKMLKELKSL